MAPIMTGVHCMNQCTLFKMGIVTKIKHVLQSLYAYLSHSPKRTQKFVDLADIVEIKG
jgi:hypothetical protein